VFAPFMLGPPPVTACTSVIYRHFELKLTLFAYAPSPKNRTRYLVFKVCLAAFPSPREDCRCRASLSQLCLASRLPRRECWS